jgi:hypothetical protein
MSAELRNMRVAKGDVGGVSIVNAATIVGLVGNPNCSVYCAEQPCRYQYHKSCCKRRSKYGHQDKCHRTVTSGFVVAFSACRNLGGARNLQAIPSRAAPYPSSALRVSPLLVLGLALFSLSPSQSSANLNVLRSGFVDTPLMHALDE